MFHSRPGFKSGRHLRNQFVFQLSWQDQDLSADEACGPGSESRLRTVLESRSEVAVLSLRVWGLVEHYHCMDVQGCRGSMAGGTINATVDPVSDLVVERKTPCNLCVQQEINSSLTGSLCT